MIEKERRGMLRYGVCFVRYMSGEERGGKRMGGERREGNDTTLSEGTNETYSLKMSV